MLIIKDKINMLMKGYPTVSDKYNVAGATLVASSAPVQFGELVKYSGTKGYYEAITGTVTLEQIAGFVLATNVKLNTVYPQGGVEVKGGEAFNLVLPGSYLAVELEADAVEANIAAGKKVAVKLATGKLTTSGVASATDLPDVVFTGTYEKHGNVFYAEVLVK